jgi:hypothetical protein
MLLHTKKESPFSRKAQILNNDAAAHKQYESFPSKKKVRLSETKAEHMTEEEKKIPSQIISVAATLYEKLIRINQLLNFYVIIL